MTRFLEILGSAGPVGAERVASTVAVPSESKPLNLLGLAALIASGPPIPTKLEFNPEDWAEVERAIGRGDGGGVAASRLCGALRVGLRADLPVGTLRIWYSDGSAAMIPLR